MNKKVFLYLYPIEEYMSSLISEKHEALKKLNECIQKRYRDKGYKVVFAMYPDKKMYGISFKDEDRIIYTDVSFEEATSIDEKGNKILNFTPKYPSEDFLIKQLGKVEKLMIGGFHAQSCVKRVGESALNSGIDTIIDLDMTDLFFRLYKDKNYFRSEDYNLLRYRQYMINKASRHGIKFAEEFFSRTYFSPAYGFNKILRTENLESER